MANRRVLVFGPAYLDRVLRVDRPLVDPALAPASPIDQSVDGLGKFGSATTLDLVDPQGATITIELPGDWPGPTGRVDLKQPIPGGLRSRRFVRGLEWRDDVGGMGSGFAAALGGTLHCALGPTSDPTSEMVSARLAQCGIPHQAYRIAGQSADWTLLVTSAEHGDKLAVGFRGCHEALSIDSIAPRASEPCDVCVVAALPNRLAAGLLAASSARTRLFAPTMRSMRDREHHLARFAAAIDILSCNRHEWDALEDRERVVWLVSILIVTNGARGSTVRFTTPTGDPRELAIAAFPRDRPPRDTNRAGEAFASTVVSALIDSNWDARSGVVEESLIRSAAERASVAAALELDRLDFGFPSRDEIDRALHAGRVV
jgi:ribokinase